jgi:hypothetical protein
MRSIIQKGDECYFCGSSENLEIHHVFGGATRDRSETYGLTVKVCRKCHDELHFSKDSRKMMDSLRAEAQRKFEEAHTHEEFMALFHRNWL